MKKLYLLRHAKSDWQSACESDHDRPLARRGVRAARLMGRFLTAIEQPPDSIVTSSALRARRTVELAAEAGQWSCPIRVTRHLYDATPESILREIAGEADTHQALLIAGHQPTFSEVGSVLVGGGDLAMVTAALVRIDLEIDRWSDVDVGAGVLAWSVTPKLLERAGLPQ
ncbi:MAG: histidine phosphatase family protein [bacterium]|nr:histidine phosphatase family protein [bacterium]